jgi:hypothetical protein
VSTGIYRALMMALEGRRVELGLSMAAVNDLSGVNDGYYAKMIYPDTPSGRQARWEQVHDVVEALFGAGFTLVIVPDEEVNHRLRSAPRIDENISGNSRQIRHWRHRKHFEKLGRLGGEARAKLPKWKLTAIARKANKVRWSRARAAKRAGEAHRAANEARAT